MENTKLTLNMVKEISSQAIALTKQTCGDTSPFFVNDECDFSDRAFAQQIVQNVWMKHNFDTSEAMRNEAIEQLAVFEISEDTPMLIHIFHDGCTTHSEYVVKSAAELVNNMIENYREFDEE